MITSYSFLFANLLFFRNDYIAIDVHKKTSRIFPTVVFECINQVYTNSHMVSTWRPVRILQSIKFFIVVHITYISDIDTYKYLLLGTAYTIFIRKNISAIQPPFFLTYIYFFRLYKQCGIEKNVSHCYLRYY